MVGPDTEYGGEFATDRHFLFCEGIKKKMNLQTLMKPALIGAVGGYLSSSFILGQINAFSSGILTSMTGATVSVNVDPSVDLFAIAKTTVVTGGLAWLWYRQMAPSLAVGVGFTVGAWLASSGVINSYTNNPVQNPN